MQGTIWLANYGWRYETGITLVGVVGFTDNKVMQIAVPGFDSAFDPPCSISNRRRVEAAIKNQIKQRFPDLFNNKRKRK